MSDLSGSNLRLLKKLNGSELYLDYWHPRKRFIFPHAFLINSKFNLFSKVELLNKAVRYWKRLHPLLNCEIVTVENERYFALASDELNNSLNNLHYLYFKNELDDGILNEDHVWKFIYEYEYMQPLNGLCWRLKILKLTESNESFNYCFVFTLHHAISDGRNSYAVMIELCDLIHKAFNKQLNDEPNEQETKLSKQEYDYLNDPRIMDEVYVSDEQMASNIRALKLPEILLPKNGNDNDYKKEDKHFNGTYLLHDGTTFLTATELLAKLKSTFTGHRYIKIDGIRLKKMNEISKKYGAKMASCFSLISALAYSRAARDIGATLTDIDPIINSIPINLRQFCDPPLEYRVCGNWMSRLSVKIQTNDNETDFYKSKFWQIAKENNDSLHSRLKNGEHFKVIKSIRSFSRAESKGLLPMSCTTHFSISSLGALKSSLEPNATIKIRELYSGISFTDNVSTSQLFQDIILTIDDTLCWSITYPTCLVSTELADCVVKHIEEIITKIID